MTTIPTHMILRNGVYNYRRRVPPDLQNHPRFAGKAVFQVSLGVRTLAEARRRALELGLDDLFLAPHALAQTRESGTILTSPLLRQIADEGYRRGLESLRKQRDNRTDEDGGTLLDEIAAQNIGGLNNPATSGRTRAFLRRELTPMLTAQAEGIASRLGIDLTGSAVDKIVGALFESEIALEGARVDLAGGHTFPSWSSGGATGAMSENAPTAREAHWSFRKLSQAAVRQQPKGGSWEHKVEIAADMFDDYVGETPVYKIDRRKVRDFIDDLRFMPKNMEQRFPSMSLSAAIEANRERDTPYPSPSPNTIQNNYFSVLRWVFNYAVQREALQVNPCTGIVVADSKKGLTKQKKPSFKIEELNALFLQPPFTGSLSAARPNTPGDLILNDHRKWVPLLMLFTGARPSEIAQLAVADVRGEHQYPHISILTEYDPEDQEDDQNPIVSFKTANARRELPIHPELVALGFLQYVGARKQAGDVRLFPDWKLSGDVRKLYTSATWIRTLNDTIIPKITRRRPKPTLYSFRHTWKTRMAASRVPPQFQNQLLGHANVGMDDHYLDQMEIADLYNAVKEVKYDGLELSRLKRD